MAFDQREDLMATDPAYHYHGPIRVSLQMEDVGPGPLGRLAVRRLRALRYLYGTQTPAGLLLRNLNRSRNLSESLHPGSNFQRPI